MGLLRITIEDSADITAQLARLHVSVKGTSAVMGNAAGRRAAEVRTLVAALAGVGLNEDAIEVKGVRLATSSGGIGRSQKVDILLVVTAAPDRLPAVLGVLADQPNLVLGQLEWVFDSFEASIPLAAEAMRKARRKADAVAEAAGHTVVGVHNASDSWSMPEPRVAFEAAEFSASAPRMARASAPEMDLGIEFTATQKLHVHLVVDFDLG